MQSRQVFALLFHELDHRWTTGPQREHYHRFCGSWCAYRTWIDEGGHPDEYSKETANWVEAGCQKWERGIFAGIDTMYPLAFRELVAKFRILGNQELMQRCSIPVTTNVNESMHARFHLMASKAKHHALDRLMFAGQQVMLNSNFGLQRTNLDCVFGTRSNLAEYDLGISQRQSHRVAESPCCLSHSHGWYQTQAQY